MIARFFFALQMSRLITATMILLQWRWVERRQYQNIIQYNTIIIAVINTSHTRDHPSIECFFFHLFTGASFGRIVKLKFLNNFCTL